MRKPDSTSSELNIQELQERQGRRRRALFSAALTLAVMGFYWLVVMPPQFTNTNDDAIMASFAYGYMGTPSPYLAYINVLVGYVLKALKAIIPGAPWYFLAQIALVCCSSAVISYLIMDRFRGRKAIFPLAFFFLLFGYDLFSNLQFTKTSAISTAAGIMLMYYAVSDKWKPVSGTFAAVLILAGSLYRFKSFLMVGALLAIPGVLMVIRELKGRDWRGLLRVAAPFAAILVICVGCYGFSEYKYSKNPGWAAFKEINPLRDTLQNGRLEPSTHGFPDYDENIELYESLDISKKDLQLYATRNFGDPEFLNTETLQALVDARPDRVVDGEFFGYMFSTMYDGFLKYELFPMTLLAFLGGAVCFAKNRKKETLAILIYEVVVFLGLQFYFFYIGRYLLNRVDLSLFMAITILLMLRTWDPEVKLLNQRVASIGMAAAVFLVSLPAYHQYYNNGVEKAELADMQAELRRLIESDQDHFYAYYTGQKELADLLFDVWDVGDVGSKKNTASLGTWRITTPIVIDKLAKYGITNLFEDMVDSDVIYLVCMEDEQMRAVMAHIKSHYEKDANAKLIKKVAGQYLIYQVITGGPEFDTASAIEHDGSVVSDLLAKIDPANLSLRVDGEAYQQGASTFRSRVYVGITDETAKRPCSTAISATMRSTKKATRGGTAPFTEGQTCRKEASARRCIWRRSAACTGSPCCSHHRSSHILT